DDVAERVRLLRQYGSELKYLVAVAGAGNSRLDEVQAAFLRIRLSRLDELNAQRREIVARYAEALPSNSGRFVRGGGEDFVAHLALGVLDDRERARARFEAAGVMTDLHSPIADHRQPAWQSEYSDVR